VLIAISFVIIAQIATPAPSPSARTCPTTEVEWTHSFRPGTQKSQSFHTVGTVSAAALVTVNPDGSVKSVTLKKSSHYSDVDAFTISQARNAIYKPKTVNCEPVQGTYLFKITLAVID